MRIQGPSNVQASPRARNIGVVFDSTLSMERHVNTVCKTSHFHLKNIRAIRNLLTRAETEKLVHAFVTSRLDLNNSLLYGIPQSILAPLQRVQNTAARLITGALKYHHVTPVLQDLHWLPISYRVKYKIVLLVFKALNGLAPEYINDLVVLYKPVRTLRSSGDNLLRVPITKTNAGDRAFSGAAPSLWNRLPADIRHALNLSSFKSKLKSYLFCEVFSV